MIQTEVGHDAIDPGVERTLEAEARQIDVGTQERLLINVLSIFRRTGEMDGEPQHGAIVLPHQFFERGRVALLGLTNSAESSTRIGAPVLARAGTGRFR